MTAWEPRDKKAVICSQDLQKPPTREVCFRATAQGRLAWHLQGGSDLKDHVQISGVGATSSAHNLHSFSSPDFLIPLVGSKVQL